MFFCLNKLLTKLIKKDTMGITEWSHVRVHIKHADRYLDVGSGHPAVVSDSKGSTVRRLKSYASWVQNGASQFGLCILYGFKL